MYGDRSFQIVELFGNSVRTNVEGILIMLATGLAAGSWIEGALVVGSFAVGTGLHLASHWAVALAFGKGIERMVLTRAGVIDYTGAPPGFAEGILRTLAGPSTNALSAGIGYALLASGAADAWHPFAQTALATFSVCSLILTAINFLPAIPFDGGLVLQSVLSRFLGDSRGRTLAAWISLALLGAMAALGAWLIQPILLYLAVTIGYDNWRKHLRPVAEPAAIVSR